MAEIVKFDELSFRVPKGVEPDASGQALQRAELVQGGAGFHAHAVQCPPGTVLPPHSHNHSELFIVLGGSCQVGDTVLHTHDTVAIAANEVYGVVAGDEGLTFMVVRTGAASLDFAKK